MPEYAKGTHAIGRCGRCGDKVPYSRLRFDGHYRNLLVCDAAGCRDIRHPQEKPFNASDATALKNPAPDVDNDSAGAGGTLAATLFPGQRYFGGGT